MRTHNDPCRHWRGDHGFPAGDENFTPEQEQELLIKISQGIYTNCHAWQFTPDSFGQIMSEAYLRRESKLKPLGVYKTPRNGIEFCASLSR